MSSQSRPNKNKRIAKYFHLAASTCNVQLQFSNINQTFNSFSNLPRPIQEPYISWKGKPHDTNSSRDINKTYNLNLPTNARPIIPGFDTNTTNNRGRANPIKHWRKQLVPTVGNYSRSAVTVRNAIDAPGANSKQTKTETVSESGNNCLKSNNIKHFLTNNMVNNCSKEDPNKKLCDPTTIRRPATTIINTHFEVGASIIVCCL